MPNPAATQSEQVILLVEDDESIRPLLAEMLEMGGYKVIAAANTTQALSVLSDSANVIDLLFTDIAMPERLNGFGLAHRAKELRPELPIIYASGYLGGAPWQDLGLGYGPVLQKPFNSEQLIAEVRKVLARQE
jgi:DNA-binding NtrC family response regulator